ncbi:alpha/beta hydrolase family protein [Tengunoibacter tsumagoiensis]|uniref:Esterase n=1 Tax=Tengunoibacter tsumagoiensis TaxID=2014871 RepID=A0A401ZYV5_9CHLR|nr:alpha/beta hydrolase [Tengunoibacter tsumagoiensis]GCE12025.1 esterase [Tengunoibacter tsumagoiensis]
MASQHRLKTTPRVVYTLPEMQNSTVRKNVTYKTVEDTELQLDVYYPASHRKGQRLPAVILIHGDGSVEDLRAIKDGGQYEAWGQLISASGIIAITANHRSTEALTNVAGVANDIDDLITYVRDHNESLQIHEEALGIWICSAGGPMGLRAALYDTPPYVRCIVCYYTLADLKTYYDGLYSTTRNGSEQITPLFTEDDFEEFSAVSLLQRRSGNVPPIFIARAGLDNPLLNESLEAFVSEAIAQNVEVDFMNHPTGQHGFDILNDDPRSHEIIRRSLEFMQTHLL